LIYKKPKNPLDFAEVERLQAENLKRLKAFTPQINALRELREEFTLSTAIRTAV